MKASKRECEAISIFAGDLRHARRVKGHLITLANNDPEVLLDAYGTLDPRDQKSLLWLKRIAQKNLDC